LTRTAIRQSVRLPRRHPLCPCRVPPVQPVSSYRLGDQTALGRAIGINPNATDPGSNNFRSAMAGLGQGLTAAGNSKGKSAGQALASGAGGAITGSTKQDNTQYDQRLKSLQLAVQAKSADNKSEFDKNYAKYLLGKDAADKAKSGKSGSWNKPDSQKFIDAQNAKAKDPDIRASEKMLEQVAKDKPLDSPEVQQAQAAHTALVQQKQNLYLSGVGLSPAKIQANIQNPPGTTRNPHIIVGDEKAAREQFDTYVKPGQAYRNPRDGKIYIRKVGDHMDDDAPDQQTPAAPAPSARAAPARRRPRLIQKRAKKTDVAFRPSDRARLKRRILLFLTGSGRFLSLRLMSTALRPLGAPRSRIQAASQQQSDRLKIVVRFWKEKARRHGIGLVLAHKDPR
jgi:hypothetical protein